MSDLIADGLAWLEEQRAKYCASPIVYIRANGVEYEMNATYGRTRYQVMTEGEVQIPAQIVDFLLPAGALLGAEPQPGEKIRAGGAFYEIVPFGEDLKGWRWSDPFRTSRRVHAVEVADE